MATHPRSETRGGEERDGAGKPKGCQYGTRRASH